MKLHFGAASAMFLFDLVIRPTIGLVAGTLLAVVTVTAAELFNTAIERSVDLAADGRTHPLAKQAKDSAAAAVLLVSLGAIVVGLWLGASTWPWRWRLLTGDHPGGAVLSSIGLLGLWSAGLYTWLGLQSTSRERGRTHE